MKMISFEDRIRQESIEIKRMEISTLQINIGRKCNQTCSHCHVNAGPDKTENMDMQTADRIIELLEDDTTIKTVDITGGAPELNPHFTHLVSAAKKLDLHVIDRCNLTALLEEGQENTAAFLAENEVEIIASLPCYTEQNVDAQRGKNCFSKSIQVLNQLNEIGYGQDNGKLVLNLVYNPGGPFLPGQQQKLEADYKARLFNDHGIVFNSLYTITNLPINRFAQQLREQGKLDEYMELLYSTFNAAAAQKVMCTSMISVGWDGKMYDCDFNQMLERPLGGKQQTIFDISSFADITSDIVMHDACFACTAGSGSSCGGTLL